jgi:hypothetical protein
MSNYVFVTLRGQLHIAAQNLEQAWDIFTRRGFLAGDCLCDPVSA